MPVITRAAFRRALGGLSTAEFVAFVADLWAARGYDTHVDGTTVSLRTGGERTTLLVRHDGSMLGRLRTALGGREVREPDLVVTSGAAHRVDPGTDADVFGAGDLYELALYGVDREACAGLFEEHLGRSPTVDEPAGPGLRAAGRGRAVGVAAVVLVALVAAAAAGPLGAVQPGGSADAGGSARETIDTNVSRSPPTATGTDDRSPAAGPPDGDAPRNPEAVDLAATHAAALENRSVRVVLNYTVSRNGTVVGYNRLDVSFGPDRREYTIAMRRGGPEWTDTRRDVWTNRRVVAVRTTDDNGTSYRLLERKSGVLRDSRGNSVGQQEIMPFEPAEVDDLAGLLAAVESVEIRAMGPSTVAVVSSESIERSYERIQDLKQPEETPATLGGILDSGPARGLFVFRFQANLSDAAVSELDAYGEVENATLTGIVDSDGRIYVYTLGYDRTVAGKSVRTTRRVAFGEVGTADYGRPAWYDTVVNATLAAPDGEPRRPGYPGL